MADEKAEPVPFVVDVTVDRTRVQVTLLLKPGTEVTVAETKTTTEPLPEKLAAPLERKSRTIGPALQLRVPRD